MMGNLLVQTSKSHKWLTWLGLICNSSRCIRSLLQIHICRMVAFIGLATLLQSALYKPTVLLLCSLVNHGIVLTCEEDVIIWSYVALSHTMFGVY